MPRRHTGGGGSRFHLPLQTFERSSGASQAVSGDVLHQNVPIEFYYYEDFLWDAFDITEHPLAIYDASASGTPTTDLLADATGGVFQIKLAATSEAETVGFTQGDNLYIQGNTLWYFETRLKVVNAMAANQVLVWGLGSDVNTTTLDNITRNAWFRLDADADLLVELDDNTTDTDDYDTGEDITADTYYIFGMERGIDGKVHFYMADGDGENARQVHEITDAFGANNLQPILIAQKASGTSQPELNIDYLYYIGRRL